MSDSTAKQAKLTAAQRAVLADMAAGWELRKYSTALLPTTFRLERDGKPGRITNRVTAESLIQRRLVKVNRTEKPGTGSLFLYHELTDAGRAVL